jgi:uncharacterized protein YndB with AHSA1/START domain
MTDEPTRDVTKTLEIHAPPEAVWEALTEADELINWFPLEARVEPGEGGTVYLGWDDPWRFDTRIEVWEPGRRLRLVEQRDQPGVTLAMDFQLESRGGSTVLRLVHSGFGMDADWDHEYHGVENGWTFELRSLRHYLERHPGRRRHLAFLQFETGRPSHELMPRLLGPEAFLAGGSVTGRAEGEPYEMWTVIGEDLGGTVLVNRPEHFAGIVRTLDDGIFRCEMFQSHLTVSLAIWGDDHDVVHTFRSHWQPRIAEMV